MDCDIRQSTASYYDRFSHPGWDDTAFYKGRLASTEARVVELGCGTGRVMVPLAQHTAYIHGLDLSPAMLAICRGKLAEAGLRDGRACAEQADITDFDLTIKHAPFDLITAPFRVMQNLETDEQIDGLMRCIRKHLAPGGEAVLNTFMPRGGYDELAAFWSARDGKQACWEKPDGDGTVTMTDDCTRFRDSPLVVYPSLIYRRFDRSGRQIDESRLDTTMRVWQPDQLLDLVRRHGFRVKERFGGYKCEAWGAGPELVVAFTV